MKTNVLTETWCEEFLPVNDEYRPFPVNNRRNLFQVYFEIPLMVRALKLPRNRRILEIGCGQGVALLQLAQLCLPSRLVGIDIDFDLLRKAKTRIDKSGARAELYQEDVRRMSFADESFDLVIDFGTCYHINRKVRALREISRVLVRGGILVHETRVNQVLSHPCRSLGQRIPWKMAPSLEAGSMALFWATRVKESGALQGRQL